MPNKFYLKELPDTAIYLAGAPFKFDILETADPLLISELNKCVARGIGGVVEITEEQFREEVKKKESSSSSRLSLNQPRGRQELSALHARRVAEAVGRGSTFLENGTFAAPQHDRQRTLPVSGRPMPDPIEIPSPHSFDSVFMKPPPTAKASEIKADSAT